MLSYWKKSITCLKIYFVLLKIQKTVKCSKFKWKAEDWPYNEWEKSLLQKKKQQRKIQGYHKKTLLEKLLKSIIKKKESPKMKIVMLNCLRSQSLSLNPWCWQRNHKNPKNYGDNKDAARNKNWKIHIKEYQESYHEKMKTRHNMNVIPIEKDDEKNCEHERKQQTFKTWRLNMVLTDIKSRRSVVDNA